MLNVKPVDSESRFFKSVVRLCKGIEPRSTDCEADALTTAPALLKCCRFFFGCDDHQPITLMVLRSGEFCNDHDIVI